MRRCRSSFVSYRLTRKPGTLPPLTGPRRTLANKSSGTTSKTSCRRCLEWIHRYETRRPGLRMIDLLPNTAKTPTSSGTKETPFSPGHNHAGWVRPDEALHTLAREDARQTRHCERPCCICPQSGPVQCESTCGNGRWKLTNSLVANIPK